MTLKSLLRPTLSAPVRALCAGLGAGVGMLALTAALSPVQAQTDMGRGNGQSARCLGLDQAVGLALAFDPRIDSARAGQGIARSDLMAARSRDLPQLSLFGQTGFNDTAPLERRRDDQVGIQLQQELYSFGGRRLAKEAAKARLEASRYDVEQARADIAQGAAIAFLDFFRANRLVDLFKEQEAAFGRDAATANSRLERQVITLTDASQIKARYARAQSDSINALVEAEVARSRLAILVDRPVSCINPKSIETYVEPRAAAILTLNGADAVDEAFVRSPSLRAARTNVRAAQASKEEARRAGLPVLSLSAFSLYGWEEEVDLFGNERNDRVEESRVGLNLTQDLYAGGRLRAQRLAAKSRLKAAQADERLERLVVEDAVRRSLAQATAFREAGFAFFEARREARIQLDATTTEYERGTKTLTDLVLATEDFYTAASQELNARYEFYASLIQLYAAMGILSGVDAQ